RPSPRDDCPPCARVLPPYTTPSYPALHRPCGPARGTPLPRGGLSARCRRGLEPTLRRRDPHVPHDHGRPHRALPGAGLHRRGSAPPGHGAASRTRLSVLTLALVA